MMGCQGDLKASSVTVGVTRSTCIETGSFKGVEVGDMWGESMDKVLGLD